MRGRTAHEIASAAIAAETFTTTVRDPIDGGVKFAAAYRSKAREWISGHRFEDVDRADSAARVLAEFLGARFRS